MTVDTVLVTGAFGQVGKRCTQILLERGRTVVAMDLRNDGTVAAAKELAAADHSGTLIPAYVDLLDAEAVNDLVAAHRHDGQERKVAAAQQGEHVHAVADAAALHQQHGTLTAEPRPAYLLRGPARNEWEHSIPPIDARRYSLTFRTLRENAPRRV